MKEQDAGDGADAEPVHNHRGWKAMPYVIGDCHYIPAICFPCMHMSHLLFDLPLNSLLLLLFFLTWISTNFVHAIVNEPKKQTAKACRTSRDGW